VRADAGSVVFEGRDITARSPHALARMGVARTFQITSVFAGLTALENVQVALLGFAGRTWGMWGRAREMGVERGRELLALVGLAGAGERRAGALSHGDQKRLELAIALAARPRLLLLDEPTAGMTARERLESIHLVRRIADELGLTVVFTEHDMAVVFAVATQISVLHQGRLLAEGAPEAVRADPQVQQVYLGEAVIGAERGA
jgi:branched-chain amino acid transport system ATP-binding protein